MVYHICAMAHISKHYREGQGFALSRGMFGIIAMQEESEVLRETSIRPLASEKLRVAVYTGAPALDRIPPHT